MLHLYYTALRHGLSRLVGAWCTSKLVALCVKLFASITFLLVLKKIKLRMLFTILFVLSIVHLALSQTDRDPANHKLVDDRQLMVLTASDVEATRTALVQFIW